MVTIDRYREFKTMLTDNNFNIPEKHPDFQKLLTLMNSMSNQALIDDLSFKLFNASYSEISTLLEEYKSVVVTETLALKDD